MEHKVVLTTPESIADVVDQKIVKVVVNAVDGSCEVHVSKLDSSGNTLGGDRFSVTDVAAADINTFLNAVIVKAQVGGHMGAGTISQS